ncbi:MAG: hypothetical protein ABIH23_24385 [bacterium]
MTYETLLSAYQQMGGKVATGPQQDAFNRWTDEIMAAVGANNWEEIPDDAFSSGTVNPANPSVAGLPNIDPDRLQLLMTRADAGDAAAIAELEAAGYEKVSNTENIPLEQGILQTATPGLIKDIEGDAARRAEVERLTEQTGIDFSGLRETLGQAATTIDPVTGKITSPLTTSLQGSVAETSAAEKAAAAVAAKAQLDALNVSIDQMQGNLQGALAQQAAALKTAVTALGNNLTTLDASQRAALAQQIESQRANLEQSITEQRAALTAEVEQLRGNASTQAASRRAALEQQIVELNAAQVPMNEARIRAAESLVTAVNLGLERTRDQLTATGAMRGYQGGSSMEDAALVRAVVDARQQAAGTRGQAELANASDIRDIATYGAGGRFTIEDELAAALRGAGDYGAGGERALLTQGAIDRRGIGDLAATEGRNIAGSTAVNRANLGGFEAQTSYEDALRGTYEDLALKNALSSGTYDVATTLAAQEQDAANREAAAKLQLQQEAYPTAVSAGQILAGLGGAETATKASLIPYGTSGTTNALNTLNWFAGSATPPDTTAVLTTPDQSGNAIGNLGANLVGSAFRAGDLWKTPTVKAAPKSTVPPSLAKTGSSFGSSSGPGSLGPFTWGGG